MQLISKFNKGFWFLLSIIDIYNKYAWVIPLKDKKGITITNAFQKILDKSNCKPNKIWVDKGSEFYNRSMKSWLEKMTWNCIQCIMRGNLLLLKDSLEPWEIKFINTWLQFQNVYLDKLDIVTKYNNTYYSTIKMKPIDVKSNTYIDSSKVRKRIDKKDIV